MIPSEKLRDKYNIPVPRYTSYPPANYFTTEYTGDNFRSSLKASNLLEPSNISIYIHIPFCKTKCWYCGCNSCLMQGQDIVSGYFKALADEIFMVKSLLDSGRKVSQVHYGGGTPNSVPVSYLMEINELLFSSFDFIDEPEIAIECHPAYLSKDYISSLREAGFNRYSIGIQDFKKEVLDSVRRKEPALPLIEIMEHIRQGYTGFGINLDFIYGLPHQTPESFSETMREAIKYRPERLTLFPYAHVPWVNRLQEKLEAAGLPEPESRTAMIESANQILTENGYIKIAMDHYALPTDELAMALGNQTLHRNFQGYCTRRTTGQVYAFGVSGISQLSTSYAQNVKDVDTYIKAIHSGTFAIERGYELKTEEIVIRSVISELMCNKSINWEKLASQYGMKAKSLMSLTGFDPIQMQTLQNEGLINFTPKQIDVTESGETFLRVIASYFDPLFEHSSGKYSRPI